MSRYILSAVSVLLALCYFLVVIDGSGDCEGSAISNGKTYATCYSANGRCCAKSSHGDKKLNRNDANVDANKHKACDCYKAWVAYVSPPAASTTNKNCNGNFNTERYHVHNCKTKDSGHCCKPKTGGDAANLGGRSNNLKCGYCYNGSKNAMQEYLDMQPDVDAADEDFEDRLFYYEALDEYDEAKLQLKIARDELERDEMEKTLRNQKRKRREGIW
eukprot:220197_1